MYGFIALPLYDDRPFSGDKKHHPMQIVYSVEEAFRTVSGGCVATIGNFDGVHQGHQQLIRSVVRQSEEMSLPAVVITFTPHPEQFFSPQTAPALIMQENAKLELFAALGVDVALILPFTAGLAGLSPEDFVNRVLVEGLHVCHLFVGHDYAFGKGRKGNSSLLSNLGRECGFSFTQLMPVFSLGEVISSTRIRSCMQKGMVDEARVLLGRPFFMQGTVTHGKKRGGASIGFPTANLATQAEFLAPASGVYATKVCIVPELPLPVSTKTIVPSSGNGKEYYGVTNVGTSPTFGDVDLRVETHILDFHGEIYDTPIRLWFVEHLRGERKFTSVQELSGQIALDIAQARTIFSRLQGSGSKPPA